MDLRFYRGLDACACALAVREREVTPESLLRCALERLDAVNPVLNAVCIDARPRAQARIGEEIKGPFAGVPYLVKDLLQDVQGLPTTSGSRACRRLIAPVSADTVRRAEEAGLVILGKTTTPEFGLKGITESALWGPTRNPWDTDRSPGGSSGGAAAAVAAGIVPMAGANDGAGSIRIPASYCGLFGLKPSRGRVPTTPLAGEAWEGAVSEGVLSRSVRDSARMLDVLSSGQSASAPFRVEAPPASFEELAQREPGRLRIGWNVDSPVGGRVDGDSVEAVERAAGLLEGQGHVVERVADWPVDGQRVARAVLALLYGQAAAFVARARERGARWDEFELDTRTLARLGRALTAGEYARARQGWHRVRLALATLFERYDLLLLPTVAMPPPRIGELEPAPLVRTLQRLALYLPVGRWMLNSRFLERMTFENLERTPFTLAANLAGIPAMSVPLHWDRAGLPVGVQFMAPWGEEGRLLSLATQLETAQPWFDRVPPALPDTRQG
ncbi:MULTISPECIES: amidase [unclassified Thioalkalivibrio]|uniref:amidase n=1 Tax=unclassified Thioalkalivibrio TaxID=2621013 RepID=UPI000372795C|nr:MULTISPECIES: amidase [unclassified Thioalkalivibrio]